MQQAFQGFNHLLKYIHSHFPVFYIYMWRQHVHLKKKKPFIETCMNTQK